MEKAYIFEFIGTLVLVLFGDGVCAAVVPRVMPQMVPWAYWSQYGAPMPVRAGTK